MRIIAFVLGCLLFSAVEIRAQVPKDLSILPILPQPLPAGDLISQAPDSSQWTVTSIDVVSLKAPADPAHPPPKPSISTVNKSDKLYLVESIDPEGNKTVRWKNTQFQATYLPGVSNPLIAYDPGAPYFIDFSKSDFPEISWISAKHYVGMAKLGAGMGLVFKAKVATRGAQMNLLSMPHSSPVEAIAVVDATTRRPVMLQVENELLVYQFTSGGAADVSLPPEVQQAFDSLRKRIQRASILPRG